MNILLHLSNKRTIFAPKIKFYYYIMNHLLLSFLAIGLAFSSTAQNYNLRNPRTLQGRQILERDIRSGAIGHNIQPGVIGQGIQYSLPGQSTKNNAPVRSETWHRAPQHAAAVQDSVQYTTFSQSFYRGSAFDFEDGDFAKYKTAIVWYEDGTVRIDNLFNLRTHNNCNDQELSLWGTFDASTNRITIPTPYEDMTLVAMIYGELNGYLIAGEVGEDYNFYAADALEFSVSEDRHAIETLQNALILEDYNDELSTHTCYKYIKMYSACEGQKLVTFSDSELHFSKPLYPGTTQSKSLYIANVGSETLEYNISIESEGEKQFTVKPTTGTLRSMIMKEVKLTYAPQQTGTHNATLNVSSGSQTTAIAIDGQCNDYPDYSGIVEEGEIEFHTSVEYPFELEYTFLDLTARSSVGYNVGDSWLEAIVEVPAGKIGTLSWTGYTYNDFYMGSKGTVTADEQKVLFESYMGVEYIDSHCTFSEGRHTVRFNYNVSHPEFVVDDSGLFLYSLSFTLEDQESDKAWLPYGETLQFGNFIENQPDATLYARLLNKGANPLKCLSAEDATHFHVEATDVSAATLDTLYVPVVFDVPEPGSYQGDIKLHTTAGDFTIACSALVRAIPDYSKIVASDTDPTIPISWTYSTTYPFVIDTLTMEAVNSNARELDTIANVSWMKASFIIPEGKVGVVSWDASLDIEDIQTDGSYHDYGMVFITHPSRQFGIINIGTGDLDSEYCYTVWESDIATAEYYTSGENYIRWSLSHFGDSYYEGQDEFRVSNLRIALEDFPEHAYQTSVDEIDFGQLLLGRTNTFTLQLTNMGGQVLTIDSIECDEPAMVKSIPTWGAAFKVSFDLSFVFEGLWPGENEGEITIYTNAGPLVLPYHGYVVDPEGYLLAEDFEGDMTWYRTDADGDGKCWNSLYNIYSTMSMGHCHSGEDGLGSSSYYFYMEEVDPDDWCYSPMVKIPTEGEYELSWWMGIDETDDECYQHNYSVYVGEEMNRETLQLMYTEQINGTGWQEHSINLKQWAGKEVCVSFRHFDSANLGIMKLDDVYIRPVQESGISSVNADGQNLRIYNLQGQRQKHLSKGINIICNPVGGQRLIQR